MYLQRHPPYDKLDWALIEATDITEEGFVIPGASVGATPEIIQCAEHIIIEVNTRLPSFEGLHDINETLLPPYRRPYVSLFSPSLFWIFTSSVLLAYHPSFRTYRHACYST